MALLDLSHTTLVCADCVDASRVIPVLEKCQSLCRFGAVRFLTSLDTEYPHEKIRPLTSINDYSAFLLKEVYTHVPTSHMLIVQHDGWVLNPDAWNPDWLRYDYIGPLYLQETNVNDQTVGSGGFSFRSRALMEAVAGLLPPWDGHCSYNARDGRNSWGHEDGVVTKHLRRPLLERGFVFAPPMAAGKFAYGGNPNKAYYCPHPFGFHGFYAVDTLRGGSGSGSRVHP